jgi:hypothetical protein
MRLADLWHLVTSSTPEVVTGFGAAIGAGIVNALSHINLRRMIREHAEQCPTRNKGKE